MFSLVQIHVSGTFYRSFSGLIELCHWHTGEASPEVQITDSSDSERMASTAVHLWKGQNTFYFLLCYWKIARQTCILQWYLQFPSPWSGKFQVDNTSRIGNVQQLRQALCFTDNATLKIRTRPCRYFTYWYRKLMCKIVSLPKGSVSSICGVGPLRDTVTSRRLGSKGKSHLFSWAPSWLEDNRWTFIAWTVSSTHFKTCRVKNSIQDAIHSIKLQRQDEHRKGHDLACLQTPPPTTSLHE